MVGNDEDLLVSARQPNEFFAKSDLRSGGRKDAQKTHIGLQIHIAPFVTVVKTVDIGRP
jgi:hypothetical protein